MIKILLAEYDTAYCIYCEFSNGVSALYDLKPLLYSRETPLTITLREHENFKKFFLRSGALCWKNGLELDPDAIYRELEQSGKLYEMKKAA